MVSDTENESVLGLKKAKNWAKQEFVMVSNTENESVLGLKKAKNLGKIGVSNGFLIWKMNQFQG